MVRSHFLPPVLPQSELEDGAASFYQTRRIPSRQRGAEARRIEALEAEVTEKNEVAAELVGEHMALQKRWAGSDHHLGGHLSS